MKAKIKTKIKTKARRIKTEDKNKQFSSKAFLIGALILAILIFVLLIVEYVSFAFVTDMFNSEYNVTVNDECSVIMGNLLHTIRDSTDCNLQCNNRCNIDETKFISYEFATKESDCNLCSCVCK